MNKKITYIVEVGNSNSDVVKNIEKTLRGQKRCIGRLELFTLLTASCALYSFVILREQHNKINELSKEIEVLRDVEGE